MMCQASDKSEHHIIKSWLEMCSNGGGNQSFLYMDLAQNIDI